MDSHTTLISGLIGVIAFVLGTAFSMLISKKKLKLQEDLFAAQSQAADLTLKSIKEEFAGAKASHAAKEESLASELALAVAKTAEHQSEINDLNRKITQIEADHKEALENANRNGISIATYPYEEHHGDNGWVTDDRRAEIGYKFQLFVNGIPCLQPHKIPIQVLQKKEVNPDKLKELKDTVFGIIEDMARMHPAIKAFKAAPKIIK